MLKETSRYQLFSFAFFNHYHDDIEYLATRIANEEQWNYSGASEKNYAILKGYLEYIFRKIKKDREIKYTQDNKYACFNTGLVTKNMEEIFAFFEKYRNPTIDSSPYYFIKFCKKSDRSILKHFSGNFPQITNYFNEPELLIYNPNLELITDVDHIIEDNISRFPEHLQVSDKAELRRQLFGSIEEVKKQVRTNYKIAVPQYYKGKIQLLLPLCLTEGSSNPDLALVAEKINHKSYSARTCLTTRMAYNNARLIVKPESNWLKP